MSWSAYAAAVLVFTSAFSFWYTAAIAERAVNIAAEAMASFTVESKWE